MEKGLTSLPYELGRDKLIVVKVAVLLDTVEKSGMTLGFLKYREAA